MFNLIKQVFIRLLSFSESLARDQTKVLSLNDKPCLVRSNLIDLNLLDLKYNFYSWLVSINVLEDVMSYLQKHVFQKKKKI